VHRRPSRPSHAAAAALLTLRRASVWREGKAALRAVSLEVRRGECWVVHGANGSGKSTLLQTLYGNLGVAYGGSLLREGIEPGVALLVFQRRVGFVAPELQAILPRPLSVLAVVASGAVASLGLNESARPTELRQARAALRRVGAAGLSRRIVRTLSYGQLRRVLFARAIVHAPDILLFDEPYAGLDARTLVVLKALVERLLADGATAVLATHHADEWPARVTHELELAQGRVAYQGVVRA